MIDKPFGRHIAKKDDFLRINEEIPIKVKYMNFKPEYYAGSKLTLYNKYHLIMSYTHAFYFEEAIFNFYYVCKSFRNLLIKNYQFIDKDRVNIPIRYFNSSD